MGSVGIQDAEFIIYVKHRFDAPHAGVPYFHTHSPEILVGWDDKRPKPIKTKLIENLPQDLYSFYL